MKMHKSVWKAANLTDGSVLPLGRKSQESSMGMGQERPAEHFFSQCFSMTVNKISQIKKVSN